MQIYSIIVTQNQEKKDALCKLHFNQPMVKEASVVLTVCADVNRFHKYCEQRNAPKSYDNFLWLNVSTIDASVCTQAMVLKKRTMPAYLPSTAHFLADLLDMDEEELAAQLWKNSCKFFQLPEE